MKIEHEIIERLIQTTNILIEIDRELDINEIKSNLIILDRISIRDNEDLSYELNLILDSYLYMIKD